MIAEYAVINGDECIGIFYKHESLGRVFVIKYPKINPEFSVIIHPLNGEDNEDIKINILEIVMKTVDKN